ncbi:hypothetical protein [Nakamurella leprariae]|uniref:Uncharacterized protein n=1 Tax=Nakamurella leprariae TaxID=2803911 RepID=A0A939C143_9ACTN|nr:hypothetical protein [Nakamurella leprariae]MBM9466734.1 hypothetical protein [Nakamurella leprariae]
MLATEPPAVLVTSRPGDDPTVRSVDTVVNAASVVSIPVPVPIDAAQAGRSSMPAMRPISDLTGTRMAALP